MKRQNLRKALTVICVAGIMAAAGCTGLEPFRAARVKTERQRVLQLYGDCLVQSDGEMGTLAKYCTYTAESKFIREQEAPRPPCAVEKWLERFCES
jgi:hypothetical protein